MEDNKDKLDKLEYLKEELRKQEETLNFHKQQIEKFKTALDSQIKNIKYNEGWIDFHKNSIEKHKKQIERAKTLEEKEEQEEKLKFHIEQIENHHKKFINYHKKEVEFLEKWMKFHEDRMVECNNQIEFLKDKYKIFHRMIT